MSRGVNHLHVNSRIHGDIAIRNFVRRANNDAVLIDFGMCRSARVNIEAKVVTCSFPYSPFSHFPSILSYATFQDLVLITMLFEMDLNVVSCYAGEQSQTWPVVPMAMEPT